jgi:FecR protein
MNRRSLIALLGGAAAWPFVRLRSARAQDPAGAAAPADAVGQVATLEGSATVTRGTAAPIALHVADPIFKNDTLATAADSTLGVTFDDQSTFSLSADTRIVVNEFVYEEGGAANAATINVAVGTAAFVASFVAKTGDMKISTPVATLGIRGTTGVVDVPQGGGGDPRIKLYPDTDGHVGRIEVFDLRGGRLGALTSGASAFALQGGPRGGLRAVPFLIPPQEALRDRGVLQRLSVAHAVGRRMTIDRLRTRGGGRRGPNNTGRPGRNPRPGGGPRPGGPPRGPGRGAPPRGKGNGRRG